MKYRFKIQGMPKESVYNGLSFGRQLDYRHAIDAFKARAKRGYIGAKHKTTLAGFREFKALYQPTEWWFVDKDASFYHDDSTEIWYVTAEAE